MNCLLGGEAMVARHQHDQRLPAHHVKLTVAVNGNRVADTRGPNAEHQTYCPYKGECTYYSIPAGGERSVNAAWTYEVPYDGGGT